MLHRREISLFLHNNQSMLYKSSIHSSRASHEILKAFTIHVDGRKEHALYHSNDSIIQYQSRNYLFILSSSPDSEANTSSSSFLLNPHPRNSIHLYAIPTRQKTASEDERLSNCIISLPLLPFIIKYLHIHVEITYNAFPLNPHPHNSIPLH